MIKIEAGIAYVFFMDVTFFVFSWDANGFVVQVCAGTNVIVATGTVDSRFVKSKWTGWFFVIWKLGTFQGFKIDTKIRFTDANFSKFFSD